MARCMVQARLVRAQWLTWIVRWCKQLLMVWVQVLIVRQIEHWSCRAVLLRLFLLLLQHCGNIGLLGDQRANKLVEEVYLGI